MADPDFRSLCAELAQQLNDALDFTVSSETRKYMKILIAKACTALAQPAPEPPTNDEIWAIYQDGQRSSFDPVSFARAVLARWGQGNG